MVNCHQKRLQRAQAQVDAEAAIAAQINRTWSSKDQVKIDPPPEYELPPTYYEAIFKSDIPTSEDKSKPKETTAAVIDSKPPPEAVQCHI